MKLDPWQLKFLETKGDKILCTGRQVGKSTICGKDAGDYAVNNAKKNILMIAPTERQAYGLFEKTLAYLMENFPKMISKKKNRPTKTRIHLINNTQIFCLPVGISGVGVRFLTIHRLYVDEASRIPEDVWSAVLPALLTTGGDSIYLSTPFGTQGEFYRCWINEDNKYASFTRFSISSEKAIMEREISDSWSELQRERALIKLEQNKARMSQREYAQEFLGEFIDELTRYFPDELIAKVCVLKRPQTIDREFNHYLGVDIARLGDDESTFEIIKKIDNKRLRHVESIITRKTLTTATERKIIELQKIYSFKEINIDAGSGSLGVGVFDHLLADEVTKRVVIAINNRARPFDRTESKKGKLLKEDLYDNLRALMERGEIQLLDDGEVIESLRSVQYEYITKEGKETKMRIFGNYTHVVEGIIRAAWGASKDKRLNIWIH